MEYSSTFFLALPFGCAGVVSVDILWQRKAGERRRE
jgi:hypothetical protein